MAPLLASTDLARIPYKRLLRTPEAVELLKLFDKQEESGIYLARFAKADLLDTGDLKDFLSRTRKRRIEANLSGRAVDGMRPYLFPTRPYSPSNIAELDPRCVGLEDSNGIVPLDLWARHVRAVRGVWVRPVLVEPSEHLPHRNKRPSSDSRDVRIGNEKRGRVVVAITNIGTPDSSWAASASSRPDLSLSRYKRIAKLVNQAIRLVPRPHYLIFPELSLPLEWVDSIASKLLSSGISMIAGTEYRHEANSVIYSEACMELVACNTDFRSTI